MHGQNKICITIVLCSKGYPSDYVKNSEIKNLSKILTNKNNQIFHAGTYENNKKIFSNGGRVLNITSLSKNLIGARNKSLRILDKIILQLLILRFYLIFIALLVIW